jgi:eukaryotic-like serine/threonine-protein kinase
MECEKMDDAGLPPPEPSLPVPTPEPPPAPPPAKRVIAPALGEAITSLATGNSYTMGPPIGEGAFGVVFACRDFWGNELAAKVLKPVGSYDQVKARATDEMLKLVTFRHPHITYIYDAFEFRDTFYIITERCYGPLTRLFDLGSFNGLLWVIPIARCLLQAVNYLHVNKTAHQDIHLGNVFTSFSRDEMMPQNPGSIGFKLADLGVAKLFEDLGAANTRAPWMLPPEVINAEFGPIDHRVDLYHTGLLLLQVARSEQLTFTQDEVLAGKPRELALELQSPFSGALEKALRRRVMYRTATAMELWWDLGNSPEVASAAVEAGGK